MHSMNDQEKSILVINGHLMSDNLSDNHPCRQTLYWTECSSVRKIINIFKNHKCSKMSEIGFCKRLLWRNFSSLTSNRIRKSIKELFYHYFEQKQKFGVKCFVLYFTAKTRKKVLWSFSSDVIVVLAFVIIWKVTFLALSVALLHLENTRWLDRFLSPTVVDRYWRHFMFDSRFCQQMKIVIIMKSPT